MNNNEGVKDSSQGTKYLLESELTGKEFGLFLRVTCDDSPFPYNKSFARKVCNICGESHYTECCKLLTNLRPVGDTPTIPRARLTLPSNLKVVCLADGTTTVVAGAKFERGTHFGPFQARLTTDLHPGVSLPLKILSKCGTDGYYLDTTDEEVCNWMCLVAPASSAKEQNLICYDMKQSIYYTAIKDILPGEELRVWYALYYGLKLQALPLADDSEPEDEFTDVENHELDPKFKIKTNMGQDIGRELLESLALHLPAHSLGVRDERDRWQCRFCDTHERNVALYAKHLMSHCRPKCDLCNRRFYSEKSLLRHNRKIHANDAVSTNIPSFAGNTGGVTETKESAETEGQSVKIIIDNESSTANENWTENNGNEILEQDENIQKLSNGNIDLDNYTAFGKLSSDDGNQEVITISNVNTSEIVQAQLVLSEDGSVIYQVANIPDGILTTEIEKLGLLVVENNDASSVQVIETTLSQRHFDDISHEHVWNAQSKELIESNLNEALNEKNVEIPELLENVGTEETSFTENNAKVDSANDTSIALILLNTLENQNLEQLENSTANEVDSEDVSNVVQETIDNQMNKIPEDKINEAPEPSCVDKMTYTKIISDGSFACDICSKTFVKSAYLYRHLRKHTGEFTCVNCLAVFARKENLLNHPCTKPRARYPCQICGKKFFAKKYLQRHTPLHTGKFSCERCKRPFASKMSLSSHRCRGDGSQNKVKCSLCEQTFPDETKLQNHLLRHSETSPDGNPCFLPNTHSTRNQRRRKTATSPKNSVIQKNPEDISVQYEIADTANSMPSNEAQNNQDNSKGFICEICGSIFKSFSSMKTHRFLHGERRFECKICGKRFHRKDVLQEHITVHQSPQLPCSECGKKFKTKKSLEVHMMIHVGAKRFTCDDCGKEFYQKGNLIKHQRTHTPATDRNFPCQHCSKTFISREYLSRHTLEHTQGKIFQCSKCSKSFVKKHLLEAHQLIAHSNRAFLCRYCNNLTRHRHSARRHLEQQHPDKQLEWSQSGFVDTMLAELPEDSLLLNNGAVPLAHQEIRQEQLLSLRRQHFGAGVRLSNEGSPSGELNPPDSMIDGNQHPIVDGNHVNDIQPNIGDIDTNQVMSIEQRDTLSRSGENHDLTMELATLTLQQQVELLADPLLSSNSQLQLDEINVIPVPVQEKKQGEEILLEVVEPQLQGDVIVQQGDNGTVLPINPCDISTAQAENAQVTIEGNTYILQDQVIFEEEEMTSGDILFYVLDSGSQQ